MSQSRPLVWVLNTRPALNLLGTRLLEHASALLPGLVFVSPAVGREIVEYRTYELRQLRRNRRSAHPDDVTRIGKLNRWPGLDAAPLRPVVDLSVEELRLAHRIREHVPLDAGESETLAIAMTRDWVPVIDEWAAHAYLHREGIAHSSTLGRLVAAVHTGAIALLDAERLWLECRRWWPRQPEDVVAAYVAGKPVWTPRFARADSRADR